MKSEKRLSGKIGLLVSGLLGFMALAHSASRITPGAPEYVPLVKGHLTFNKDIAPIIYENCASCHHQGEVAPFNLMNYADVKKRVKQMALVTADRTMPPWKADAGHEQFLDARRLTPQQIGMIGQWAAEGGVEGKVADLPPAPKYSSGGWKLGQPDVVFQSDAPYHVDAEGGDVYRCFVIPTNYNEDRWVAGVEVHPDNAKIVHHIIAFLDNSGQARKLDAADPGPGYTSTGGGIGFAPKLGSLAGWAPGNEPRLLPAGMGVLLPKGADIVLQVHYHKNGKPETDQSKIGLYFSKVPVDKRLRALPIIYLPLRIPAGDKHYTVHADVTAPAAITIQGIMPHMHLLGREMTVTATPPGGAMEKLVHVPDWDFNWQTTYAFKNPVSLPTGSKMEVMASYDNSADNPVNPHTPPQEVRWGEETTNEMCIAFVYYTVDDEHLTQGKVAAGFGEGFGAAAFRGNPAGILKQLAQMFDKNGNGVLDEQEKAAMIEYMHRNG